MFAYSNDGIVWVGAADPFSGELITKISWNGRIWVVGLNGARIHYSTDGLSWTEAPATGAYAAGGSLYGVDAYSIAFNNTVWVAVGCHSASELRIAYSYDGINWVSNDMTFNITGTFIFGDIVEWNGSFFSLYGQAAGGVYFGAKSYDGLNWSAINISPTTFITQLKSRRLSPVLNKSSDDLLFLTPAHDGGVEIDCNASTKFYITPNGTNALSFINLPAVKVRFTPIEITVDGTSVNIITWPAVLFYPNAPTAYLYIVQLRYTPAVVPAGAGTWLGNTIWSD